MIVGGQDEESRSTHSKVMLSCASSSGTSVTCAWESLVAASLLALSDSHCFSFLSLARIASCAARGRHMVARA